MYPKEFEQAQKIDTDFTAKRAKIIEDDRLSDQGKRAALAAADEERRAAIEALQGDVREQMDLDRRRIAKTLAAQRGEHVRALRETLGDQATIEIYREDLRTRGDAEIVDLVQSATDGWERTVLREWGRLELIARQADDFGEPLRAQHVHELDDSPAEIRELARLGERLDRDGERFVASLDRQADRGRLASTYGVLPSAVAEVEAARMEAAADA